jgi:hypothetical protein
MLQTRNPKGHAGGALAAGVDSIGSALTRPTGIRDAELFVNGARRVPGGAVQRLPHADCPSMRNQLRQKLLLLGIALTILDYRPVYLSIQELGISCAI